MRISIGFFYRICAAGLVALLVSSCSKTDDKPLLGDARYPSKVLFFPDTGSMNAQRFGDETFPLYMRHGPVPLAMQPKRQLTAYTPTTRYPAAPKPLKGDDE